jgi:hypothetical protein
LPCRFSELDTDVKLKELIRWTLERIRSDLSTAGHGDPVAVTLLSQISLLIESVLNVKARHPFRGELEKIISSGGPMTSTALIQGLKAIGWIVDERGLGGGRTSDGLAWSIPLEKLWERYVESVLKEQAAKTGAKVRVGRLGETNVPIPWNDSSHKSLSHLSPDFVILILPPYFRTRSIR